MLLYCIVTESEKDHDHYSFRSPINFGVVLSLFSMVPSPSLHTFPGSTFSLLDRILNCVSRFSTQNFKKQSKLWMLTFPLSDWFLYIWKTYCSSPKWKCCETSFTKKPGRSKSTSSNDYHCIEQRHSDLNTVSVRVLKRCLVFLHWSIYVNSHLQPLKRQLPCAACTSRCQVSVIGRNLQRHIGWELRTLDSYRFEALSTS